MRGREWQGLDAAVPSSYRPALGVLIAVAADLDGPGATDMTLRVRVSPPAIRGGRPVVLAGVFFGAAMPSHGPLPEGACTAADVVHLADWVQELFLENLRITAPVCPGHPHPLEAAVTGDTATWRCPKTKRPLAVIGAYRQS